MQPTADTNKLNNLVLQNGRTHWAHKALYKQSVFALMGFSLHSISVILSGWRLQVFSKLKKINYLGDLSWILPMTENVMTAITPQTSAGHKGRYACTSPKITNLIIQQTNKQTNKQTQLRPISHLSMTFQMSEQNWPSRTCPNIRNN